MTRAAIAGEMPAPRLPAPISRLGHHARTVDEYAVRDEGVVGGKTAMVFSRRRMLTRRMRIARRSKILLHIPARRSYIRARPVCRLPASIAS